MRPENETESQAATLEWDGAVARCGGDWTVHELHRMEGLISHMRWPAGRIELDMRPVRHMDTGGAWLLQRLATRLEQQGRCVEVTGLSAQAQGLRELVRATGVRPGVLPQPVRPGLVAQLGRATLGGTRNGLKLLAFIGEMGSVWLSQLLHPGRVRWRAVAHGLGEAGYKALAIVGLLSFLLGVVIAYQGGVQLRLYGASVFVADLVGLSMVRELAPLITAIIVAGRTGSAYTAQIGTMRVTEEIDALRSMGICPMELLVLPKLLALLIALPLLTVYADVMGMLGGMVMANAQLGIAFATFIDRLGVALTLDSYLVGVGKAPVFAAIIATLGCYQGFRVAGSAESVGQRTTRSVVQSILAVIVVDAAFSVAFSYLGI